MQYNACLVITGAFKDSSKLCFFYKILKGLSLECLTSYLQLHNNPIYQSRSTAKNIVNQTVSRTVNFNSTFFPRCSQEWNKLSDDINSLSSPISFKGSLLGLRQFLSSESPLKTMKNVFYFMLKALFVLEIFSFLSWLFGYVEKRLDKKFKTNSKIYNITNSATNNYNTHIARNLKK